MVKALFRLLWDVCLIVLAKMLGFVSVKALASCQLLNWQIIQIFMDAMIEEILVFLKLIVVVKMFHPLSTHSISGCQYSHTVFLYMYFERGVRRNNASVIHSSKAKRSLLNHFLD
ncbi:hypothetical protein KUTeg_021873 [Tegillarca granosa]|uniref:Secreted protein n=1 Tax=Tegillarca granosa TaxID=220873 RepID=A0ABQ9E4V0_TEGGR|nr:hypothetical protein KUTeg_021873 [Tegillarca granosa]